MFGDAVSPSHTDMGVNLTAGSLIIEGSLHGSIEVGAVKVKNAAIYSSSEALVRVLTSVDAKELLHVEASNPFSIVRFDELAHSGRFMNLWADTGALISSAGNFPEAVWAPEVSVSATSQAPPPKSRACPADCANRTNPGSGQPPSNHPGPPGRRTPP